MAKIDKILVSILQRRFKSIVNCLTFILLLCIIPTVLDVGFLYSQSKKSQEEESVRSKQKLDDIKTWKEFVVALKKGEWSPEQMRPRYEDFRAPLIKFLKTIGTNALAKELESPPEIYHIGDEIHYLLPLTLEGKKSTYCFTLLVEGDKWYARHLESIFIRLDKVASLPTSIFPDIPDAQKTWIREETRVSKDVYLFNFLTKEKGKKFAFNWFKDGAGYMLQVRSWVPFLTVTKAFILYVCWEQTNLVGNNVTLVKLDGEEATIQLKSLIYFELYKRSGHLYQMISEQDYRQIFETVWHDRAKHAGWDLQIIYEEDKVKMHFKKNKH